MINIVLGLGYGDEGKGQLVNDLCNFNSYKDTIVCRFSGGHQAAHTVYNIDKNHIFANFGSGTLKKVPTYWSKYCTFNPFNFLNEYRVLIGKTGHAPKIFVDKDCPVTTLADIIANRSSKIDLSNGTCGSGFGKTIEREENFFSLKVEDLYFKNIYKEKLVRILDYYKVQTHEIRQITEHLFNNVGETISIIKPCDKSILDSYRNIIFEGSQGLMLDQNIGFFPHVTRSNTDLTNVRKIIEKRFKNYRIYLVSRGYQTRHGNGPLSNETTTDNNIIKDNPIETNKTNEWQGAFRKSILDIDTIKYVIFKQREITKYNSVIVLSRLQDLSSFEISFDNDIIKFRNQEEFINFIQDQTKLEVICY